MVSVEKHEACGMVRVKVRRNESEVGEVGEVGEVREVHEVRQVRQVRQVNEEGGSMVPRYG